jgi:hypothetical protein
VQSTLENCWQTQKISGELPELDTFLQDRGLHLTEGMLSWADFHALMRVEGDVDEPPQF